MFRFLYGNMMSPDQLLIHSQPIIGVGTVIHFTLIQVRQGFNMLLHPSIHLINNMLMISFWVGTHKEPEGVGITVFLIELCYHSLLRVEARPLLFSLNFILKFLFSGVIDLPEACISEEEQVFHPVHKD